MTIKELTEQLKQEAERLGFVLSGVVAAAEPGRIAAFENWLNSGYAGEMSYLESRSAAYRHPTHVLDGCRTMLMLALPYGDGESPTHDTPGGKVARASRATQEVPTGQAIIARYARGPIDYHDVIHQRLKKLKSWLVQQSPGANVRGVVDSAPLLEREFAEAAGLGWVGKNTLLLNRTWGSYFFLAALLTDLPLTVDPPHSKGYCGTCTACLDHCPTNAFVAPYVLDARRCLSYLTIEHRSAIAPEIAGHFDQWLFGCDICQEVCPWNRRAPATTVPDLSSQESRSPISLIEVLQLSADDFRNMFRSTPLWRSKRRGLLRNAILIAVAQRYRPALPYLQSLLSDDEPLLRSAAAWAIEQFA